MGWSFIASTLSVSDDEDEHEGRGEPDPSRLNLRYRKRTEEYPQQFFLSNHAERL